MVLFVATCGVTHFSIDFAAKPVDEEIIGLAAFLRWLLQSVEASLADPPAVLDDVFGLLPFVVVGVEGALLDRGFFADGCRCAFDDDFVSVVIVLTGLSGAEEWLIDAGEAAMRSATAHAGQKLTLVVVVLEVIAPFDFVRVRRRRSLLSDHVRLRRTKGPLHTEKDLNRVDRHVD